MKKVKYLMNEYGTLMSEHTCESCGIVFTVTPACAKGQDWSNCLGVDCPSYDEKRDANKLFEQGQVLSSSNINK